MGGGRCGSGAGGVDGSAALRRPPHLVGLVGQAPRKACRTPLRCVRTERCALSRLPRGLPHQPHEGRVPHSAALRRSASLRRAPSRLRFAPPAGHSLAARAAGWGGGRGTRGPALRAQYAPAFPAPHPTPCPPRSALRGWPAPDPQCPPPTGP
ncbi:hypothetical protein Slala05_83500 [Streptomyces lavendulae subsp. lavendulae]|nr:hypothetical protein Slala05_83500 [Streptomyces lavendulae subsp. lavendulae]